MAFTEFQVALLRRHIAHILEQLIFCEGFVLICLLFLHHPNQAYILIFVGNFCVKVDVRCWWCGIFRLGPDFGFA